ncbi:MAG: CAP domain-containing protein, partial [Cyanobacteria bacterium P01_D01_bin.56]
MQFTEFAQEVLRLTNEFRQQNGVEPLTLNEELVTTAENYSQTMAEGDFFSHIGEDGSAPWDRAEDEGYTARAMGENLAAGQLTPEEVVQGWIDSPGHQRNLLNSSYTEMGLGYFELENDTGAVNYNRYWTQLFGSGDLTPASTPVSAIPAATPASPVVLAAEQPTTNDNVFAEEVLRLTNEFRAENGRAPLTLNEELASTAQKHSQAMAEGDFFSHTGLNGSAPWDRAEDEGYTARAMAENIAAGQPTPEQVVQGWIDSPGHRQNMLNPSYTELGVGYFELENDTGQVNYNRYWTQVFGSGDLTPNSAAPMREADEVDASIFEPTEVSTPVQAAEESDTGIPTTQEFAPITEESPTLPEADFAGDGNNNEIKANNGNNVIFGLAGNDRIHARRGDDFVNGGFGNDRLWGTSGDDTILGEDGNDVLGGGRGSDNLVGGLGDDVLVGSGFFRKGDNSSDVDTFAGGEGADKFVLGNRRHGFYTLGEDDDYALITDLNISEGDTIQLNKQFSYSLGAAPEGTADGQGLFAEKSGTTELVAIIQTEAT